MSCKFSSLLGCFSLLAIFAYYPISEALADNRVRITQIKAYDRGESAESTTPDLGIDVQQGTCGDDPETQTAEAFFDSIVGVTIVNDTTSTIRAQKFSYQIQRSDSSNHSFKSVELAPVSASEIAPKETKEVLFLFLRAQDGQKVFTRKSIPIPSSLGFRNVTFRVKGANEIGQRFSVSRKIALSFGDFDRCE